MMKEDGGNELDEGVNERMMSKWNDE